MNRPGTPGPDCTPDPADTKEQCQAADWFVVIHDEHDPEVETLHRWLSWMESDEGNRLAFEAVAEVWQAVPDSLIDAMPTAQELATDSYDGEQPLSSWLTAAAAPGPQRRRSGSRLWLAAASVAVIALGVLFMLRHLGLSSFAPDVFVTQTGEQFELTLADGSHVWLGPRSRLTVAFTSARRGVRLDEGEAFFAVKKDHSRPFIVHSSNGAITAVGTAFDVRAIAGRVTVAVSEGVVSVAPEAPSSVPAAIATAVRVQSGQQLTFAPQVPIQGRAVTQSATLGERARWREGVLVYRDEPLRDVVADVARYSDRQFEIGDNAAGDLRFSGVIYRNAVDEWAEALPESFPLELIDDHGRLKISTR